MTIIDHAALARAAQLRELREDYEWAREDLQRDGASPIAVVNGTRQCQLILAEARRLVGADRPPRSEPGAERKPQLLIPGVEPIGDRQRIELRGRKPLRGGNAPPPAGGLFDLDARAQGDLLDKAS